MNLEGLKASEFILLLLYGLERDGKRRYLSGRTIAQKIIFLLTHDSPLRKTLGLRYRLHYYGPYSAEVTASSELLTTFGLVREVAEELPSTTRYDLELTEEGRKRAERLYNSLQSSAKKDLNAMVERAAKLNVKPLEQVIRLAYAKAEKEQLA